MVGAPSQRVLRQPGVSDADFAADAKTIERDLKALKAILEGREKA
jgi:hypothetical protein